MPPWLVAVHPLLGGSVLSAMEEGGCISWGHKGCWPLCRSLQTRYELLVQRCEPTAAQERDACAST